MTKAEIVGLLEKIVGEAVGVDELSLTLETTPDDVSGWDSFTHVIILATVESTFGVRFTVSEFSSLYSVGILVDMIDTKLQTVVA